jgi:Mrp family chromosome partitioning ATPase
MADARKIRVLTALDGPAEATIAIELASGQDGIQLVRRCADLAEAQAVATAGLADVVLLSAHDQSLDLELVRILSGLGVGLVAALRPQDQTVNESLRLERLGVGFSWSENAPITALVTAIRRAHKAKPERSTPGDSVEVRDFGAARPAASPTSEVEIARFPAPADVDPWARSAQLPHSGLVEPGGLDGAPTRVGRLVAVWGPGGAPGRSRVALELAAELARRQESTLLVDADCHGPSLGQCLGLLDELAGLPIAVRAAQQGVLTGARLEELAVRLEPGFRILTGLPNPRRWPELTAAAFTEVLSLAVRLAAFTVIDTGPGTGADLDPGDDLVGEREAIARTALSRADLIVAVGAADPIGMQRLIRGLDELTEVTSRRAALQVVITKVRPGVIGAKPERQIRQVLDRYAQVRNPILVPDDRSACDLALLRGVTLAKAAPQSGARRSLMELAAKVPLLTAGAEPSGVGFG